MTSPRRGRRRQIAYAAPPGVCLAAGVVLAGLVLAGCSSDQAEPARAEARVASPESPGRSGTPPTRWVPRQGQTWQWQLTGDIDTGVDAEVFEIDKDAPTSAITALKAKGRRLICYVSAGSWEAFRPDAKAFNPKVLGKQLDGYPDERWLDIRRTDVLAPLMAARFDTCAARGFDAIEADNVDGYSNDSGFALTAADQLEYNTLLARLAHARGLSIGLKNDVEQIPALVHHFDFAVNEECFTYDECTAYAPFLNAGKAVFHTEYDRGSWRPDESARVGLSSLLKRDELDAWRVTGR